MAFLYANSFGIGLTTGDLGGSHPLVSADAGSPSGYVLTTNGTVTTHNVGISVGSVPTTSDWIWLAFWINIPAAWDVDGAVYIDLPGFNDYCRIDVNPGGMLTFGQDTNTAGALTITYGTATIATDEWVHICMGFKHANAPDGRFKVRIDGNTPPGCPDYSGDTWSSFSGSGQPTARDFYLTSSNVNPKAKIHSLVVWDSTGTGDFSGTDPLPPLLIEAGLMTSSGTSDMIGSDANKVDNHLLIDNDPSDITDYVEQGAETLPLRQEFGYGALTNTGAEIKGLQAVLYAHDADAGGKSVDLGFVSVATDGLTNVGLPSAAGRVATTNLTDPNGGGAWTEASRDAASLVIEVPV